MAEKGDYTEDIQVVDTYWEIYCECTDKNLRRPRHRVSKFPAKFEPKFVDVECTNCKKISRVKRDLMKVSNSSILLKLKMECRACDEYIIKNDYQYIARCENKSCDGTKDNIHLSLRCVECGGYKLSSIHGLRSVDIHCTDCKAKLRNNYPSFC